MNQNLLEAGTYLLNQHYDITNNKIIYLMILSLENHWKKPNNRNTAKTKTNLILLG